MPSSPTSVPDVLSLIGNAPVLHGATTAIEKLRAAKSTFPMFGGSGSGSMISQMMSNPSSLIQNAMGGLSGQLTQMISGFASGSAQGGPGTAGDGSSAPDPVQVALTGAGGLQPTLDTLTGIANAMASPAGILNIQAHAGLADSGADLPESMSLASYVAPLHASPPAIQAILAGLPASVAAGDVDAIHGYTASLRSIITTYTNATAGADNVRMSVAAVSCIFYGLSAPGLLGDVFHAMLAPDAVDGVMANVAAIEQMFADAKAAAPATANSDGGFAVLQV